MRFILAWSLLYVAAFGQISVPEESPRDTIIVATVVTNMPEGAELIGDGGWSVDEGVDFAPVGADKVHMAGRPGTYTLHYAAAWVAIGPEITIVDTSGTEHTIRPYLGSGEVSEIASFVVTGVPDPDPDPDPDPTPDPSPIAADGLKVLIVRESGQVLEPAQQEMLRSTVWMGRVGSGNWMVLDPDQTFKEPNIWADAMKATESFGVPRLIVSNRPKGGVVKALPDNLEDMLALIEVWAGDSGGE